MKVVLASNNEGKLAEFRQLFAATAVEIVPQKEFAIPEADETGFTFIENAIIKARNACEHTGLAAIADDSGLEVDALNGEPGIYSARFAGEGVSPEQHVNKLLEVLKDVPAAKRTARFHCVMVYLKHAKDPSPLIGQGVWQGQILLAPQGDGGFGYDPVFFVSTHNCSAAELSPEIKNKLSHRGHAMQKLAKLL
jgi:XTP/dITP diphosphohydrolase